jgi:hypothetical protein
MLGCLMLISGVTGCYPLTFWSIWYFGHLGGFILV